MDFLWGGPFFFLDCNTTCIQGLLSWEDLVALKRAVVVCFLSEALGITVSSRAFTDMKQEIFTVGQVCFLWQW